MLELTVFPLNIQDIYNIWVMEMTFIIYYDFIYYDLIYYVFIA
jgi:hypothetical protein